MPDQLKPIIHGRDHLEDGADPIRGLVSVPTGGTYEDAIRVADLTCWWRLGDSFTLTDGTFPAAIDSADFDSDSPRNLGYNEASGAGEATLGVPNPNLGDDDDGAVSFTDVTLGSGFTQTIGLAPLDEVTQLVDSGDGCRTWVCWIKTGTPLATAAWQNPILGRWGMDGSGSFNVGWVVELNRAANTIRWRICNLGGTEQTINGPTVAANTWYHLAGTFDGTTYTLYVNGLEAASEAATVFAGEPASPRFRISGGLYDSGAGSQPHYFYGTIDEVALYRRALNPGELTNIVEGGSGVTGEAGDVPTSDGSGGVTWEKPKIEVLDAGASVGTRHGLNLHEGANVTLTFADDPSNNEVDVTIAASSSGGGDPADDTLVWLPLTTVTGGVPDLVWDADDSLIPTLTPL